MDLIEAYGSDDGEDSSSEEASKSQSIPTVSISENNEKKSIAPKQVITIDRRNINPAPTVASTVGARTPNPESSLTVFDGAGGGGGNPQKAGDLVLMNNPMKSEMYQPVQGPQLEDPSRQQKAKVEANVAFDETAFLKQRVAFQKSGRAIAPTAEGEEVFRTTLGYNSRRLEYFAEQDEQRRKRLRPTRKEKEQLVDGSDDEAEYGIWGPPSTEEKWAQEQTISDIARVGEEGLEPQQLAEREYIKERNRQLGMQEEKEEGTSFERIIERKMAHLLPPKQSKDGPVNPTTTFHGSEEVDYKGRSWIAPPAGLGAVVAEGDLGLDHHKCFVPKKCVFRLTGNSKGVQRIRLFPRTGHLILSAGLDGKCKVWSLETKQVMRTYNGHSAAVRDVQFNLDGTKFLSASFDRYIRLWETETGNVLQTFSNQKVPYVVKFYPNDDNFFVVGCSDNKILCYDSTTADITQEYNHHLAPVNSIVFVESHGTKMISSSDDKKILVWEWDIGVPIKYISDPTMHAIPVMVLHPSKQYIAGQSLDNNIVVLETAEKFKMLQKKKFSGHIVSGYACEMSFSPDGQFMASGDGNGALFVWDWKRHKILQKFRAHTSGPAICCQWHPLEPSTLVSCGWDGVIKIWK